MIRETDRRPQTIEHDPDEPPPDRSKSPWLAAAVGLALLWGWYAYFIEADWISVGMGALTAGIFVSWAIDITGNRVPASWRKPPRARRP